MGLTHFDENGRAVMVDVTEKDVTKREAQAQGKISVSREVFTAIQAGTIGKGDVPVSYTHLDVYKRQVQCSSSHSVSVRF